MMMIKPDRTDPASRAGTRHFITIAGRYRGATTGLRPDALRLSPQCENALVVRLLDIEADEKRLPSSSGTSQ